MLVLSCSDPPVVAMETHVFNAMCFMLCAALFVYGGISLLDEGHFFFLIKDFAESCWLPVCVNTPQAPDMEDMVAVLVSFGEAVRGVVFDHW